MGRKLYRKEAIDYKKTNGKEKLYYWPECLHGWYL